MAAAAFLVGISFSYLGQACAVIVRCPRCLHGVCVLYLYIAACGLKGHGSGLLLPLRTAALFSPLYMTKSYPNHYGSYRDNPFSFSPILPNKESEYVKEKKTKEKKTKEKKTKEKKTKEKNSF